MLDKETQELWAEYLAAERDRIQSVTTPALDRFIDALLRHDPEIWHPWAREVARQVSDQGSEIPVRFPLFRRVLLPALSDGVLREFPGCARWLAYFESLLVNTPAAALPVHLQTTRGLLQEAVRVDPADRRARRRLVQRWASSLEYAVHETPDCVLYHNREATAEECDQLRMELEEFRTHVTALHQDDDLSELIAECDLHFRSYREYLLRGRPGGSYEQFLALLPAPRSS